MDSASLEALQHALAATPENGALRAVVVRALREGGDDARAAALARDSDPTHFSRAEDAVEMCRALLAVGDAKAALHAAPTEGALGLLFRARALAALGRNEEGQAAYRAAVRENATLEDPGLAALLGARVVPATQAADGRPGRPALRVIHNDDADVLELDRALAPPEEPITFADVGGLEDLKQQIRRRIILPFQKPSLFERFKRRAGGGILLYGPPGCGKTLIARATAGECDATCLSVSISDVLDMYIGESERKLSALFEKARSKTPSILFFDELEALAGSRRFSRNNESAKLVSAFLSEMDGFARNNSGVLVLGATNTPWAVDSAFRRPGRFDRVLFVPPPDREARASILSLHFCERPLTDDVDVQLLAKQTQGYSGADLEAVVDTAADIAIELSLDRADEVRISQQMLLDAVKDVKSTTAEWLSTARNHARYADAGGQYEEVLRFLDKHGKKGRG
ncbi:MAG: ATP-binding protein [Sandaracinaceae bacterium]|nr:ATP-binding protein [Sandaracinaceae bacterium]